MTQDESDQRLRAMMEQFVHIKRAMFPSAKFGGSEELVLHYGQSFYRDFDLERTLPRLTARKCFQNAIRTAREFPHRFFYTEGYAISSWSPIPIHHAWVVDRRTGLVLDPTWTYEEAPYSYMGIPMKTGWVVDKQLSSGFYALFESPNLKSFCLNGVPKLGMAKLTTKKVVA